MEREFAVLVIGDEESTKGRLREALRVPGWRVCTSSSADEALRLLDGGAPFDAVVLDACLQGGGGLEALRRYREGGGQIPVVVIGAVDDAAEALLHRGANHCLPGAWSEGDLAAALRKAVEVARPLPKNEARVENKAVIPETDSGFVLLSDQMKRVFEMVDRVADADVPVMIRGESGVGKDVVARAPFREGREGAPGSPVRA